MSKKKKIVLSIFAISVLGAYLWAVRTKSKIDKSVNPEAVRLTKEEFGEYVKNPQKYTRVELYVTNSDLVTPMNVVRVFEVREDVRELVTDKAIVVSVRWKVAGPFKLPKAPVDGFLTLLVTNEAAKMLRTDGNSSVEVVVEVVTGE